MSTSLEEVIGHLTNVLMSLLCYPFLLFSVVLIGVLLSKRYVFSDKHVEHVPFYMIVISVTASDLCQLSVIGLHVLPERWHLDHWPGVVETIVGHFYMFTWYTGLSGYCIMALNRYVAVVYPTKLKRWCTVRRSAIALALCWLLSLVLALLPLFGLCCVNVFQIHDESSGVHDEHVHDHDEEEEEEEAHNFDFMSPITLVLNMITVMCLVVCYGKVMRTMNKMSVVGSHPLPGVRHAAHVIKQRRVRRLMSMQAVTQSTIFALFVAVQTPLQFGFQANWWLTIIQALYTLTASVDIMCVLIYQRTIRNHVLAVIMCKKKNMDETITQSHTRTRGTKQKEKTRF